MIRAYLTMFRRERKGTKESLRGFSLIELLIYIAFVSIIAVVFVNFTLDLTGSAHKARVHQELQQNARFAMERVMQEIRAAEALNTGASTFGSHPGILSLSTTNPVNNPTVFDVSGGVLRIKQGAGAAVPLIGSNFTASNFVVDNLSVNNRTTNVRVTLTIQRSNPNNVELFDAEETVYGAANVRELAD